MPALFQNLPLEILNLITEYLNQDEISKLSRTCRNMYLRTQEALHKDVQLFRLSDVHQIMLKPRTAKYVRRLTFDRGLEGFMTRNGKFSNYEQFDHRTCGQLLFVEMLDQELPFLKFLDITDCPGESKHVFHTRDDFMLEEVSCPNVVMRATPEDKDYFIDNKKLPALEEVRFVFPIMAENLYRLRHTKWVYHEYRRAELFQHPGVKRAHLENLQLGMWYNKDYAASSHQVCKYAEGTIYPQHVDWAPLTLTLSNCNYDAEELNALLFARPNIKELHLHDFRFWRMRAASMNLLWNYGPSILSIANKLEYLCFDTSNLGNDLMALSSTGIKKMHIRNAAGFLHERVDTDDDDDPEWDWIVENWEDKKLEECIPPKLEVLTMDTYAYYVQRRARRLPGVAIAYLWLLIGKPTLAPNFRELRLIYSKIGSLPEGMYEMAHNRGIKITLLNIFHQPSHIKPMPDCRHHPWPYMCSWEDDFFETCTSKHCCRFNLNLDPGWILENVTNGLGEDTW